MFYGSGTYRLELGDDSVLRVKKNGNTVWNSPNAPINSSGWSYMFREPKMATTITSYRGWRTLNGQREFHPGIDITEYSGGKNLLSSYDYPVYSVNDGYVAVATTSSDGAKYVVLELNDNYTVRYFHLYSYNVTSSTSTKKTYVSKGQKIGIAGNSGLSTGAHLHFDVNTTHAYYGNENLPNHVGESNTVDPIAFFPDISFK